MDISAGIQKKIDPEDDDFDYVYHLPHANPDRIIHRDPLKSTTPTKSLKVVRSMSTKLSMTSPHSIHDIRCMLNPSLAILHESGMNSRVSSRRASRTSRPASPKSLGGELAPIKTNGLADFLRRTKSKLNTVSPGPEFKFTVEDVGDEDCHVSVVDGGGLSFRAMPDIVYKYVNPNYVAGGGLALMALMILQVIISIATEG